LRGNKVVVRHECVDEKVMGSILVMNKSMLFIDAGTAFVRGIG